MSQRPAVLFVCLGNICRSPLAEAAFRETAAKAGLDALVDSAGTGSWHVGQPPDRRAQDTALKRGIDISAYRARQIVAADYIEFTHIFALDDDNLETIRGRSPSTMTAELGLLLDVIPDWQGRAVADPYYGGPEGFERTWNEVSRAAEELVRRLR
jgi:protein-tyrosine phosphatase